jgi:hypothetical protein
MRKLVTAVLLLLSGCEYEVECEAQQLPKSPVSNLVGCHAVRNWVAEELKTNAGRYTLRLYSPGYKSFLDLSLPLANGSGTVKIVKDPGFGAKVSENNTGWIYAGDAEGNGNPFDSTADSGEVQLSVEGAVPTDSSGGDSDITVDFGNPGVTLTGRSGGTSRVSGTFVSHVVGEPKKNPGGGGTPCSPCADYGDSEGPLVTACKDATSAACYCAAAKMHQCTIDSTGCSTDVAYSTQQVRDMVAAAEAQGGSCNPSDW